MSITRRHIANDVVGPEKLSHSVRLRRYCFEPFMAEPLAVQQGSIAFPAGTDAQRCIIDTGFNRFEYTTLGGASDLFVPVLGSEGGYGWNFDKDTLAEGCVVNFGGIIPGHPRSYTVANEDFFARILLNTEDASGLDAAFGFVDAAAIPAGITDYTNYFGIRILGNDGSTDALVRLESNLGNTGSTDPVTSTASTTLEEPTEIELEVQVVGRVAKWFINGAQVAGPGLITAIGSTACLVPQLRLVQTTDLTTRIITRAFECGRIFGGGLTDRYPTSLRSILTSMGVAAGT